MNKYLKMEAAQKSHPNSHNGYFITIPNPGLTVY